MANAEPRPIDRNAVALFAIPMAILTIMGWIGDAFMPWMLDEAPLLLLVCAPRLRNLVLVSPEVSIVPFVTVAVLRLIASDPLFYWFGRRYGDAAIRWMEKKFGQGASPILWFERGFKKAAYPMVALVPNNWICLLAGATAMNWWVFATLNLGGTIARIMLIRLLGDAFSDPILSFNDWIGDNRLTLTVISIAVVFLLVWNSMRKGEIESPAELAEELEEEMAAETGDVTATSTDLRNDR